MLHSCKGAQWSLILERFKTLPGSWHLRFCYVSSSGIAIKQTFFLAEYPWLPLTHSSVVSSGRAFFVLCDAPEALKSRKVYEFETQRRL